MMAVTYDLIASTSVSTPVSSVSFASIAANWNDLVLVCSLQTSATTNTRIVFNDDTAANYSFQTVTGNGTTASGAQGGGTSSGQLDYTATPPTSGSFSSIIMNLVGYRMLYPKGYFSRADNAALGSDTMMGMWRNSAAITKITVKTATTETFSSGCVFSLYGIKAA